MLEVKEHELVRQDGKVRPCLAVTHYLPQHVLVPPISQMELGVAHQHNVRG